MSSSLSRNRDLGHYRLVEPIGEGGMGVVWRATDTTLGRDVAIKVLPDAFANDPERLARFDREARLLASLNHPHIASIFGLHAADGIKFLAMELVEGEDLSQRLSHGPVPIAEALPIALQIAQALEHAHEKGVIHRDLKPANVKLDAAGKAKVLDFGLAKALEGDVGRSPTSSPTMLSQSPTITGNMTGVNVLLGTAAYMAPEQARGQIADRRADIWAFGVVVVEMLTGRRLFDGETISDTLASVLKTEVDWSALPADTPPRIRALLKRCLERQPKQRLRDIGEARITLEHAVAGDPDEFAPAAAAAGSGKQPANQTLVIGLTVGGAILASVLGVLAGRLFESKPAPAPLRKFQLLSAGDETAEANWPAISPDGRMVAYTSKGKMYLQVLGELQPKELPASANPECLFWSPDSRHVGYVLGSKLMKVGVQGMENTLIGEGGAPLTGGRGACWLEDGTIVFSRGDTVGLLAIPALGGDAKPLVPIDTSLSDFHEPAALPDGRGFVFSMHRHRGGINTLGVWSKGKIKILLELPGQTVANPAYSRTGHILFGRGPTTPGIWAVPFSVQKLEVTGDPFLVAPNCGLATVSNDGTLAYRPGGTSNARQLAWLDHEGKELGAFGEIVERGYRQLSLGPDDRRVAASINLSDNLDVWVFDTARGTRTRLTFGPEWEDAPEWSPTGDRIVHDLRASIGSFQSSKLVVRRADGTGVPDTVTTGYFGSFTPDGQHLIYGLIGGGGAAGGSIMEIPLEGPRTPRALVVGNPIASLGQVRSAGDLMSYMSNESGHWEVFLTRYPSGEGKWQVSTAGGQWPRWNGKGDFLYFAQGTDMMEVSVEGTGSPILGTPKVLFRRASVGLIAGDLESQFAVASDGKRFVSQKPSGTTGPKPRVTVVQNWLAEFKAEKKK